MKVEGKEVGSFEITRYYQASTKEIVITHVKVLDKEGKYIKFAKLSGVLPYLSKFPVRFKELDND